MQERIATYMGRPASCLTREELIRAYSWAVGEIQRMRESARLDHEMAEAFNAARDTATTASPLLLHAIRAEARRARSCGATIAAELLEDEANMLSGVTDR